MAPLVNSDETLTYSSGPYDSAMRLRVICTRVMYSSAFTQVLEKMQQRSAAGIIDGEVLQHAAAGGGAGNVRLVDAERVHEADHIARQSSVV